MIVEVASIATVLRDKRRLSGRWSGTSQDAIHQDDELGNRWNRDKRVGGASRPFFCLRFVAAIPGDHLEGRRCAASIIAPDNSLCLPSLASVQRAVARRCKKMF